MYVIIHCYQCVCCLLNYLDETCQNNLHEGHADFSVDLGFSVDSDFSAILVVVTRLQSETHKMNLPNHYWLEHHGYSCLRPNIQNLFCFVFFIPSLSVFQFTNKTTEKQQTFVCLFFCCLRKKNFFYYKYTQIFDNINIWNFSVQGIRKLGEFMVFSMSALFQSFNLFIGKIHWSNSLVPRNSKGFK